MIELQSLSAGYDGPPVVRDISLTVNPGEVTALLGINGAGKSTIIKCLMGLIHPSSGKMMMNGSSLHNNSTQQRLQHGLVCVPEDRGLFPNLTVLENLKLGFYAANNTTATLQTHLDECYNLFPKLYDRREQVVATQSGGEQQMLALARGLMASPKYLLLDEPTFGLSPMMMDDVFKLIETLKAKNIGILLVEQNMHRSVLVADSVYLLVNGRITDHANAADIGHNRQWLDKALGVFE